MATETRRAERIVPQKNEFSDSFLDVVGSAFRFDHAKGLSEWIKNSADAYSTTAGVRDDEQYILLRFRMTNPKRESIFECIDFVGMTKDDIDKALKVWGLTTAAKKGTSVATYGGHGNGGKFYMRQMFSSSRYITFRGGKLNVFGFDENKRYGFAKNREDVPMSLKDALKFADIDVLRIPDAVRERWAANPRKAGFTVVRGEHPHHFSGRATVNSILEKLRVHPQARRVLNHKQVFALSFEQQWGERILPPSVSPREGFEAAREIPLPRSFEYKGEMYQFRSKNYPDGKLILRSSDKPLARSGDLAALNCIDIIGEVGCIGSYRMNELGFMRHAAETEFIYGECEIPLLEAPELNSVSNDRERLEKNPLTDALLEWIRQQVDSFAGEMAEKQERERKTRDLRQSSLFNQVLDRWKNQFMIKLSGELFGGSGVGGTFGGFGGGGDSKVPKGKKATQSDKDPNSGEKEESGGGSGEERRQGPRFPRVLLSGYDVDPLDPQATSPFVVDERQPPVYQRDIDIKSGIYWINTARPLANKILDKFGAQGPRWREYLFQRYIEIILKQSIYELGEREPEFTPDKVDNLIDKITTRVHDAAADDLEQFLFNDNLTGSAASVNGSRPSGEPLVNDTSSISVEG